MMIDILGIPHVVSAVPSEKLPPGSSGQCDENRAEILIDEELVDGPRRRILLHEIIHAIEEALELELSEAQVVGLAAGLNSIPQLRIEASE
jgi:hypothetical protein